MIRTGSHGRFADLPEPESIIDACGGENPLRFLAMSEPDTAIAIIQGIDDLERLRAWRRAEREHVDPPRDVILQALDEREAALTGYQVDTTTDDETDPDPEPAPAPDPEPTPDPMPAEAHADVTDVLQPGFVLEIDRGEKIEYVWPTRDGAAEPYVSLAVDVETGDPWMELTVGPATIERRRLRNEHSIREASDVSIDPPGHAITDPGGVA